MKRALFLKGQSMNIIIRKALPADAEEILEHLKQIGGETNNLSFGVEGLPFSVEAEKAYLSNIENSKDSVMLVAKANGRIVGNASLSRLPRRMNHRGDLAVSVTKEYWNCGIGSKLMSEIIHFAKDNYFDIIDLQVKTDNLAAIHLYEKFGFEKLFTYPAFFKINEKYYDVDYMCLRLK